MSQLEQLLQRLGDRGALLWVESGRLKYAAPAGTLDADLLDSIKQHRDELIRAFDQVPEMSEAGAQVLHRLRDCPSRLWWQHIGGQHACLKCHPPTHRCTCKQTNYTGVVPVVEWRDSS